MAHAELPRDLTWPGLLAHWTALAQASLALPKDAEGQRWRDAVPAIIGLHAIAHALGELDKLTPEDDRAVAQDRASIGIQTHATTLHMLWKDDDLHDELRALIDDARTALAATREGGVEWCVVGERLVVDHPAQLVSALIGAGFKGDIYLPVPGTVLFQSSPAAFARGPMGEVPSPEVTGVIRAYLNNGGDAVGGVGGHARVHAMRQVYRQFDFGKGGPVRDLVQPMNRPLPAGQSQIVPALIAGEARPVTLPIPGMAGIKPLPVVFAEDDQSATVPI